MKKFEELDVIDDFLMNALANDVEVGEEFCKSLVKGLLQRKLEKIRVNVQRVITPETPKQRGIRLDVEILELEQEDLEGKGVKNIYDIEPHLRDKTNLPKHNRFYQAKIDGRNMNSGEKNFINLPNLYIITITNYDPFGYGYMMYTVNNACKEVPELEYEDGLKFIYFNTKGVKTLPEVRSGYMTLEEKIFYERLDAREEEKLAFVKRMLERGMTEKEICDIAECDIEYIRKIQNDMK